MCFSIKCSSLLTRCKASEATLTSHSLRMGIGLSTAGLLYFTWHIEKSTSMEPQSPRSIHDLARWAKFHPKFERHSFREYRLFLIEQSTMMIIVLFLLLDPSPVLTSGPGTDLHPPSRASHIKLSDVNTKLGNNIGKLPELSKHTSN